MSSALPRVCTSYCSWKCFIFISSDDWIFCAMFKVFYIVRSQLSPWWNVFFLLLRTTISLDDYLDFIVAFLFWVDKWIQLLQSQELYTAQWYYFCNTMTHTKPSYLNSSRPWTHVHQCWNQTWRLPEADWRWSQYLGVYLPRSISPGVGGWLLGHQTWQRSQNYIPHCFPTGSPKIPRWPHWCWTRGWPKSSRHCCCTPEGSLDWRLHQIGQLGLHHTYLERIEGKSR